MLGRIQQLMSKAMILGFPMSLMVHRAKEKCPNIRHPTIIWIIPMARIIETCSLNTKWKTVNNLKKDENERTNDNSIYFNGINF